MLAGGRQSPLWQTLQKHSVDLYLCGETQTIGCVQADGILQIAHGGLATVNYTVATVYPDRIDLEVKKIDVIHEGAGPTQAGSGLSGERLRLGDDVKAQGFTTVGTAVLHRDRAGLVLSNTTGGFGNPK
jgi:hypothetical protein